VNHFLVTTCWRGALNIGNMRRFSSLEDVARHVLAVEDTVRDIAIGLMRVYQVSDTEPPRLCTREAQKLIDKLRPKP